MKTLLLIKHLPLILAVGQEVVAIARYVQQFANDGKITQSERIVIYTRLANLFSRKFGLTVEFGKDD